MAKIRLLILSVPMKGNIIGGQPLDIVLEPLFERDDRPAGSFHDVETFHKWFETMALVKLKKTWPPGFQPPPLDLPNHVPIIFSHADLDMSNIMISLPEHGPARIIALIDWHQSGWYPAYWEYHKACALSCGYWGDLMPAVMDPFNEVVDAWGTLINCYAPV
jgi:hypothetical protein